MRNSRARVGKTGRDLGAWPFGVAGLLVGGFELRDDRGKIGAHGGGLFRWRWGRSVRQSGRCCLFSAVRKNAHWTACASPATGRPSQATASGNAGFGHQCAPGICQAVAWVAHAWILAVLAVPVAAAVVKSRVFVKDCRRAPKAQRVCYSIPESSMHFVGFACRTFALSALRLRVHERFWNWKWNWNQSPCESASGACPATDSGTFATVPGAAIDLAVGIVLAAVPALKVQPCAPAFGAHLAAAGFAGQVHPGAGVVLEPAAIVGPA